MTEQCFQDQMKRIVETWGYEPFPLPRVEEIFAECQDLSDLSFVRIVTRLIGEHPIKYPPTVREFREFSQAERKRVLEAEPNPEQVPSPVFEADFKTSDDALNNVKGFFNELITRYTDRAAATQAFKESAQRVYPALDEEVESLKRKVISGSIESRLPYVVKARSLILRTFVHLAFNVVLEKAGDPAEAEAKRMKEAARKFDQQVQKGG